MDEFFEFALGRKHVAQWLVAGGVLLLIIFGFVWWRLVYENPYNVFWGMLSNSLATSSVTRQVVEQGSGTDLREYIGENFGPHTGTISLTTLKTGGSTVKTETVSSLGADFVRYTSIKTDQKSKSGKPLSFANLLNKWAKSPTQSNSSQATSLPFLMQTMLGLDSGNVVPIANLSPVDRASLITQLHNSVIFDTSFTNVQKSVHNGRPVYTYAVNVEPVAYVGFEKAFASAVGIHALNSIDPNSYQGDQPIKVDLGVDVHSHQLVEVSYPGTSHQEYYSSWGVLTAIPSPHASISGQQLQNLVSQIQ